MSKSIRGRAVAARIAALVALAAASGQPAHALVAETSWEGVKVTLTYPEKVIFDTPFSLVMEMDGSTLVSAEAIAFQTRVRVSESVVLDSPVWGSAGWHWEFATTAQNFSVAPRQGTVGQDVYSAIDPPAGGMRQIQLFDPYSVDKCAAGSFDCALLGFGFTWLYRDFDEKLTWTLDSLVIRADTNVELILDDQGVVSTQLFSRSVLVLDPPPPVPEPAAWASLLAGLTLLGLRARRIRRGAAPQPFMGKGTC